MGNSSSKNNADRTRFCDSFGFGCCGGRKIDAFTTGKPQNIVITNHDYTEQNDQQYQNYEVGKKHSDAKIDAASLGNSNSDISTESQNNNILLDNEIIEGLV